jgi:ABC-type spermidine/putrescine transport system permease subunit II
MMLFRIFIPVVMPGLIAATIFAFTVSWGSFLYPLAYLYTSNQMVLTVGIVSDLRCRLGQENARYHTHPVVVRYSTYTIISELHPDSYAERRPMRSIARKLASSAASANL